MYVQYHTHLEFNTFIICWRWMRSTQANADVLWWIRIVHTFRRCRPIPAFSVYFIFCLHGKTGESTYLFSLVIVCNVIHAYPPKIQHGRRTVLWEWFIEYVCIRMAHSAGQMNFNYWEVEWLVFKMKAKNFEWKASISS